MLSITSAHIQFPPGLVIDLAHLGHARFGVLSRHEIPRVLVLQPGKLPDLLADLHRAEFRAAHAAEMGGLGAFGGEGLVVILFCCIGIERQVELVAPAEFEAGL